MAKSFIISVSFPCCTEIIFAAPADSCPITMWSNQRGQVELFNRWGKGIVQAYEQDKQLYFIWKPLEWAKEDQTSIVPCLIKQTRIGAKLILKHSVFPNNSELQICKDGLFNLYSSW